MLSILLVIAMIVIAIGNARAQNIVPYPQYDTLGKIIIMRVIPIGENEIRRDTMEVTSKELISVWNPQLMMFEDKYVYRTKKVTVITKIKP